VNRSEKGSLGFYLQILILLAVFLASAAVLVQVFAASRAASLRAARENDAAALARSAAEAFAAEGTAAGTARLLGAEAGTETGFSARFDETLRAAADGAYCLTVTVRETAAAAGSLAAAHIAVTGTDGTEYAVLDTEKYLPGGGGAAHGR
jgi:type II secretory pathway pseudopilin PulG